MIYLIVGPSCAGKTQFATNAFLENHGEIKEHKDLLTYCENNDFILIGKWLLKSKVRGTDKLSRADIPKFYEQVERLSRTGKDIVLEGDKCYSRPLCEQFAKSGMHVCVIWVRCSIETSIKRSKEIGQTATETLLKTVASKARNFYYDVSQWQNFTGVIIDTDSIEDLSEFKYFGKGWTYSQKANEKMEFCVFILTHGRAGKVKTDKTLRKHGYTGKIYYVIDNEDEQQGEYRKLYGDNVIVFDKADTAKRVDTCDNFEDRRVILFARNAAFEIARKLGVRYFQTFDDDVQCIEWRYTEGQKLKKCDVKDYDKVIRSLLDLLKNTNAVSVALAQNGDFIGGADSARKKGTYSRKCMNSFICKTDRPICFIGRMNEDVAAYTIHGMRGDLMLTCNLVAIKMTETQATEGGMTEAYLNVGTYVKSAYSLITSPSCVKIAYLEDYSGNSGGRIHHNVIARNAYVKILREEVKEGTNNG